MHQQGKHVRDSAELPKKEAKTLGAGLGAGRAVFGGGAELGCCGGNA